MESLVRFTLAQRVLFNLVFIILMVAGLFAVSSVPAERYPEVNFGKVVINAFYPGRRGPGHHQDRGGPGGSGARRVHPR
jgi:multidrug efflux pump subunit AcrB